MTRSESRPAGIRASSAYSPELESLRGWAILLVFVFHIYSGVTGIDWTGKPVSPWLAFVTAGHTGVTLFFVLSAFLLSRPFLEEERRRHPVRLVDFYRRRVLRIMPLYAVAIVVAVVLCLDMPGAVVKGFRALFFVTSFMGKSVVIHALMPYSTVWWSLGTEVQFYLALPVLGFCLRTRGGRWLGIGILIVWAVLYGIATSDPEWMASEAGLRFGLGLPGRAPAFLAGIGAAWLVSRHGERIRAAARNARWLERGGSDGLLFAALAGLGLLLQRVSFLGFTSAERIWPIWHLAESALWGLILLLVVLMPIRVRPLVSNPVLARVGLLSYSLYLVHVPILLHALVWLTQHDVAFRANVATRVLTIVGILGLCLAVSALTYRFIERPFLLRKARIDG
jgi:peptidoglycan/LPS O-acetylase OafA/YrhL